MKSLALHAMIALTGMVFGAEIVASHVTQSLTLLISAYHMLYNILSLLLLVISRRMSKGKTLKNTFGWARVKILGMLINMLFLCALCFAASVECVQTVVHASHENTEPQFPYLMLAIGIINLITNIISYFLIGGYTHHQGCSIITIRNSGRNNCALSKGQDNGANTFDNKDPEICAEDVRVSGDHKLIDMSRDTSSCLAVISCACIILLLDGLILKYADAILAAASIVVLIFTTYPFIRESCLILLQSIPKNMDMAGIANRLCIEFPAIQNVHDLHVWRLTAAEVIATVHVIVSSPSIYDSIALKMKDFFEKEGISLVTIQPEFVKDSCTAMNGVCYLSCSSSNNCGALTCCGSAMEENATRPRLRCAGSINQEETYPCLGENNHQSLNTCTLECANNEYDFGKIHTAEETNV